MADTPAQWLPILAKRLDDDMPRIRLLARYVDGDAPLPEGGQNVRASWQKFQKQARTNWGLMIREAVANRIVPNGIVVGGSADSPAAVAAQTIWRNNRMDSVFKDWLRYGLTFRQSFMTVWAGVDGPVITADSPETMCVSADPLQPWRVRSALRVWRDMDQEKDFAIVWMDGARQKFSRSVYTGSKNRLVRRVQGDWDPVGEAEETTGAPPVVVYNNPGGLGEFEAHLDVINRINQGILNRLVIEAMQAYRQRALKAEKESGGLPKKDGEGNDIDWAKVFEPAPGALWDLPPGLDIWESETTDTRPLLEGSRDDIRHLSSGSFTPLPMLMPDNANQTAAGATATTEGYLAKCGDRCAEAKVGGTAVLVEALKVQGVAIEETLELLFEPVERVSMSEKYAAAAQAKAAGLPDKTIWRSVLGMSPEQIAQASADASEASIRELVTNLRPAASTASADQQVNTIATRTT